LQFHVKKLLQETRQAAARKSCAANPVGAGRLMQNSILDCFMQTETARGRFPEGDEPLRLISMLTHTARWN
jgi:hypothetical protein